MQLNNRVISVCTSGKELWSVGRVTKVVKETAHRDRSSLSMRNFFRGSLYRNGDIDRCPAFGQNWPGGGIMIKKVADGYKVMSEKGKNLGGPYKSKKEAEKRLKQVEFFKRKKA